MNIEHDDFAMIFQLFPITALILWIFYRDFLAALFIVDF